MGSTAIYALRDAHMHDLHFLFGVIVAIRQSKEIFDWGTEFRKFKENFEPSKVQIIQHQARDVGRLRVVRSKESIYVGGIQLLPASQHRGIGSAIFADLIRESEQARIPITLEVFEKNPAFRFYTRLGFVQVGTIKNAKKLIRHVT